MENSILSGNFITCIVLRESNIDIKLCSDIFADQLLLKSLDKGTGTDRQILILCCTTVKCFPVNGSAIIKINDITILNRGLIGRFISRTVHQHLLCVFLNLIICYQIGILELDLHIHIILRQFYLICRIIVQYG